MTRPCPTCGQPMTVPPPSVETERIVSSYMLAKQALLRDCVDRYIEHPTEAMFDLIGKLEMLVLALERRKAAA